jgi:uncharacterized protein with GYD domain
VQKLILLRGRLPHREGLRTAATPTAEDFAAESWLARYEFPVGSEFRRRKSMASYVMLFHYTHQGIEHVKQSAERIEGLKQIFNRHGAKVKDFYALLGQYDTLFIVEAPNQETVAKLSLYIAEQGNVRVETHPAFTEAEFRKILSEIE